MPSPEHNGPEYVAIDHIERIVRGDGTELEVHHAHASSEEAAQSYARLTGATSVREVRPEKNSSTFANNFQGGEPSIFEKMKQARRDEDARRKAENAGNN